MERKFKNSVFKYKNRKTGEIREFSGCFLYADFDKDWELLSREDK